MSGEAKRMTDNEVMRATEAEAKARAERIRKGLPGWRATTADIIAAYQERDWAVLGYDSWEVYVEPLIRRPSEWPQAGCRSRCHRTILKPCWTASARRSRSRRAGGCRG